MEPRVDFYLLPIQTVEESYRYGCILAEKAYLNKQKTLVWAPSKTDAENFNRILWTFKDTSFVPHALCENIDSDLPVFIGFENHFFCREVLINLTSEVPSFFKKFHRVIELVINQPEFIKNSRKKYRIYHENQCELFSHDFKNKG